MMYTIRVALFVNVVMNVYMTDAYAQLADTMVCADKECSETISEGKARLAYRPRDDKFLNLEKGDVVLVKSKNAGKKSHLWGGQEFLKSVDGHKSPDLYAGLIGENQRITVDKSKKKKSKTQSDSGNEDVADVDPPSSADAGSTEANADSNAVETTDKPVEDNASKNGIPLSLAKVDEVSKPVEEEPELARTKRNVKTTDGSDAQIATPLPPHIAAIMEESLKLSQKTDEDQDSVEAKRQNDPGKEGDNVADGLDTTKIEDGKPPSHSYEDSPDSDPPSVQSDKPTEDERRLPHKSTEDEGHSPDKLTEAEEAKPTEAEMKIVHHDSVQEATIDTKIENSEVPSTERSGGFTDKEDTNKLLVGKEDSTSSNDITDTTWGTKQSVQDHQDVSSSKQNEENYEVKDPIQGTASVGDVTADYVAAGGNPATVRTVQNHVGEAEGAPNSEVNESSNDQENDKKQENDIADNQDAHEDLDSGGSHGKDDEGKPKLTQSMEQDNLDNEEDGPFEDDIDDDFEIEYLVVSEKENNVDGAKPAVTDHDAELETVESTAQPIEEQNTVVTSDPNAQTDHTKKLKAKDHDRSLDHETLPDSQKSDVEDLPSSSSNDEFKTASETDNAQDSGSKSDIPAAGQTAHDSDNIEKKLEQSRNDEGTRKVPSTLEFEKSDVENLASSSSNDEFKTASEADNVQDSGSKSDIPAAGQTAQDSDNIERKLEQSHNDEGTRKVPSTSEFEEKKADGDGEAADDNTEILQPEADYSQDSGSESEIPAAGQTAQDSDNIEKKLEQSHNDEGTRKVLSVPEFEEKKANGDGEAADDNTEILQPEKNIKIDEENPSLDYGHTQSADSSNTAHESDLGQSTLDDSVEPRTPVSTWESTGLTNGDSGSNSGSASDQTEKRHDGKVESIPVDSQNGDSESTAEDTNRSDNDGGIETVATDVISSWDVTQQQPTDPPTTDTSHSASNITEDFSKSTTTTDEVTVSKGVAADSPSDISETAEPTNVVDTPPTPSSSETTETTTDLTENLNEGGEKVGADESDGPSQATQSTHQEQSEIPREGRQDITSSQDEGINPGVEQDTVGTDEPEAIDKFDGGEKVVPEDPDEQDTLATTATEDKDQSQRPKDDIPSIIKSEESQNDDTSSKEQDPVQYNDSEADDKKEETADDKSDDIANGATFEGNSDNSTLDIGTSSNSDAVGREEKVTQSENTGESAQDTAIEHDSAENLDIQNLNLSNSPNSDIPPPGPPPESFVAVDQDEKLTGQPAIDGPHETPQSQSDVSESEVQDSNDTALASVSTVDTSTKTEHSSDQVLQLDSMGMEAHAKSEEASIPDRMEQSGGDTDSGTGKYKILHEGKVVDWDETIQEKPKDSQPLTWDEAIGGDVEDLQEQPEAEQGHATEHEVQGHSAPPEAEVNKTTSEEMTEILPVHDDVVEEQIEATLPPSGQDIIHEQVEATQSPSIIESTTEEPPEDVIMEKIQQTPDVTLSPPDVYSAEGGENINSAEAIDETLESDDSEDSELSEFVAKSPEHDGAEESFLLRFIIILSNIPGDVFYVCEPLLEIWVSLLPPEYQNDVFGVSWPVIFVTLFVGFLLISIFTCRSRSAKSQMKNRLTQKTIEELRTQLENLSKEKVDIENDLRTKQNEIEIQQHQISKSVEDCQSIITEKTGLENTIHQFQIENEDLRRRFQELSQIVEEKDGQMQQMIANAQKTQEILQSQEQALAASKDEIKKLQVSVHKQETVKKDADISIEKFKERIKNLEKSKGEVKKEGKVLKDQIDKLNDTIGELQQKLYAELEDGEQRRQEIDVLKDCLLQFRGAKEVLADESDEDVESEESLGKQKEKMKAMVDVANVKKTLRQVEAVKLQVTYELEAEKENRIEKETKVTELEAVIQSDEVVKSKLQRDIHTLESKLAVMQEFYAKREVEIQSKLGFEKSKLESNTSLLEDKEKQQSELIDQLHMYKQMCEEAKQKYDESERKHKQEIVGFEKRSHDNWLACREAERKFEEANKQISRLQLEMGDMRMSLRESERDSFIRPRPERHGPPGGPPPFGPSRRHFPPGSPLHFRNAPPDARRSPPHRRPPSPGGSIPENDRPPSRPNRPPSSHSLPPMGPGHPYGGAPERPPFRDGPHPTHPPPRDVHPQGRPPSGPILRGPPGPMTSSPYMERPPIPSSHSPRGQAFMQSSLHATPPQPPIEGLRTDGPKPPSKGAPLGPPNSNTGGGNPLRRSKS